MPLRKYVVLIPAAILVTGAFAGCGSSETKPPTPADVKEFETICDKANEGKRVAVEGYMRFPDEINRKVGFVLRLFPTSDAGGKPVGVSVTIGNQPNQVGFIPKEYTDKDLKVTLANGDVAGYTTKVKVSGDVYYPLVGQEFQCALSNPLIESSK